MNDEKMCSLEHCHRSPDTFFSFSQRSLEEVKGRLKTTTEEAESLDAAAKKAEEAFIKIRNRRVDIFMQAFEHVSMRIDVIYKVEGNVQW